MLDGVSSMLTHNKRFLFSIITSSKFSTPLPPFWITFILRTKFFHFQLFLAASSFEVCVKSLFRFQICLLWPTFTTAVNESRCCCTFTQLLGCKRTTIFVKLTTSTSKSTAKIILFFFFSIYLLIFLKTAA